MTRPQLLIFDVNETLSDLTPMAQRFTDVGAPAALAKAWFASTLRDGFALSVVGENPDFAALARDSARTLLAPRSLSLDLDAAVDHVLAGFGELRPHPDVADGLAALAGLGIRMVTLSNGATAVAEKLLGDAGLRERFERLLSVADAPAWKPAAAAYRYALETCGVEAGDAMLVAVHPWDLDGAARAGLRTAWIDRAEAPYPGSFTSPEVHATDLVDLARQLA
jgi:2-haloacid dehalogenase